MTSHNCSTTISQRGYWHCIKAWQIFLLAISVHPSKHNYRFISQLGHGVLLHYCDIYCSTTGIHLRSDTNPMLGPCWPHSFPFPNRGLRDRQRVAGNSIRLFPFHVPVPRFELCVWMSLVHADRYYKCMVKQNDIVCWKTFIALKFFGNIFIFFSFVEISIDTTNLVPCILPIQSLKTATENCVQSEGLTL